MAAERTSQDATTPRFPEALPGELWGVTTYYNPAGYRNKLEHLERFAASVRAQGLRLMVVELAFGDQPFQVADSVADIVERRRTTSVLWQKERLLNIGIGLLPKNCDKVAWLDCDLVFENDDWVAETASLLEDYRIVQPFDTACWLLRGADSPADPMPVGYLDGEGLHGMAAAMSKVEDPQAALMDYKTHGHLGFAWAGRRSLLEKHGLYDAQILGNGDFVIGHAMFGDEGFWEGRNWECKRLSPKMLDHVTSWGRRFYDDVQGSVFYVDGRVLHLWHGAQSDRQYGILLDVLTKADFDPDVDLALDDNECWTWATDQPELHAWAADYFKARREE